MVQVVTRCVCLHLNLALTVCVGEQLAGISANNILKQMIGLVGVRKYVNSLHNSYYDCI